MKNIGKILIIGAIGVQTLVSCSGYERENFRMEVGKEYALKKWPDSAYIDTLERFFAKEYVREQRQRAEISMNMGNSVMSLPKKSVEKPSVAERKAQRTPSSTPSTSNQSTESFPDKFFYALYKLTENPGSSEFGRKYRAKEGENLDALLLRVYGAQAKRVPKNLSENMIRRLNPGININSFADGDMVLLPNVK